ncbi:MAG TPA: sulfotransferase domain-containing protein [Acidimicrobiales bacterium]|nr:sulfotransferase domain-containing protein [Acidimicrobiales bacterium]
MALGRVAARPKRTWRRMTATRRVLPDFVILGAQRGGTTSLFTWLMGHPSITPPVRKEVHYFDRNYDKGENWYRAHFPLARPGLVTGEASPYLLFHPLTPARVARDLPSSTRFIAVLRDPVERAVSHYWHERRLKAETEPLGVALALEDERLAGATELLLAGERSFAHFHFSYAARGRYAEQLRRWFDAVGRDRILVVESERMFSDPEVSAGVTTWLGLPSSPHPFPAMNSADRVDPDDVSALRSLEASFVAANEELFELLGYRMWGK